MQCSSLESRHLQVVGLELGGSATPFALVFVYIYITLPLTCRPTFDLFLSGFPLNYFMWSLVGFNARQNACSPKLNISEQLINLTILGGV